MCTKEAEYDRVVHCNAPDYGPLRENIEDSGDAGREKVVGKGGNGPGGRVGSEGGIIRGGGGGR